jgi:hypothetical protein
MTATVTVSAAQHPVTVVGLGPDGTERQRNTIAAGRQDTFHIHGDLELRVTETPAPKADDPVAA